MSFAYGMMTIVCVIETFGYMTSKTKYIAMAAEFAVYILYYFRYSAIGVQIPQSGLLQFNLTVDQPCHLLRFRARPVPLNNSA